jgi:hypothetical protein
MHFGFMDVILLYSGYQHVSATHLQDGENKDTDIITMCLNHSIVLKIV